VKVDVGAADELDDGRFKVVEVSGREVGVIRWRGRFYAVSNVCPHMGGPVCGELIPKIVSPTGAPGELAVEEEVPVIVCGWHSQEFDARTGRSLTPEATRLRTYRTEVVGGRVLVDLRASAA
jgi:nitrite reductase (NADH) small subunit